jgi:hypothetical protein
MPNHPAIAAPTPVTRTNSLLDIAAIPHLWCAA